MGMAMLLKEHRIQLFDSVRDTSCARTLVYPISSIWSICRYMFFVRALTFFTSSLSGKSWLLVRMAGLGNRASMAIRGGTLPVVGDGGALPVEFFLSKKLIRLPAATLGAFSRNSCCRLAYASPSVLSGLGGSIGRKLKFAIALGFSLKNCGLFTVTLTKYRISASPGNPPSVGGSVAFTCCVGVFANSGIALENETLEMGLFVCWHCVLRGS